MNIVILMGRMVRNPELKYTSSGKAYANFTLAVQKNKNEAEFIDCTAWEKTAETIAEYFEKGSKILIQGRLSVSNYEQNGEKRKFTRILTNSFEFVESKNTVNAQSNKNDYDETEDDEDFPF
nr:MAG TPA: Single strand binding protein [Caudoviricetes sp.]